MEGLVSRLSVVKIKEAILEKGEHQISMGKVKRLLERVCGFEQTQVREREQ